MNRAAIEPGGATTLARHTDPGANRAPTPQIIVGYGAHDPGYTAPERIDRTALHRDLSAVIVVPTRGVIPARVVDSWLSLAGAPNQKRTQVIIAGMEVGAAYNAALDMILGHPELSTWRYMVTLEEDNLVPPFAMIELLNAADEGDWDVLGALYWIKGEDGVAQIWGDRADELNFRPQRPDPAGGIVPCWGTGMGFTAFRLDQFKRRPGPWFNTYQDPEHGCFTQDLAYFADMHRDGHELKVGVHCGIKVGHYDVNAGVVW